MRIIGKDNGLNQVDVDGEVKSLTDAELDELYPELRVVTATEVVPDGLEAVADTLKPLSIGGQAAELAKDLEGAELSTEDEAGLKDLQVALNKLFPKGKAKKDSEPAEPEKSDDAVPTDPPSDDQAPTGQSEGQGS